MEINKILFEQLAGTKDLEKSFENFDVNGDNVINEQDVASTSNKVLALEISNLLNEVDTDEEATIIDDIEEDEGINSASQTRKTDITSSVDTKLTVPDVAETTVQGSNNAEKTLTKEELIALLPAREQELIKQMNIDLSEEIDIDGYVNPKYVITKGATDGEYHIYERHSVRGVSIHGSSFYNMTAIDTNVVDRYMLATENTTNDTLKYNKEAYSYSNCSNSAKQYTLHYSPVQYNAHSSETIINYTFSGGERWLNGDWKLGKRGIASIAHTPHIFKREPLTETLDRLGYDKGTTYVFIGGNNIGNPNDPTQLGCKGYDTPMIRPYTPLYMGLSGCQDRGYRQIAQAMDELYKTNGTQFIFSVGMTDALYADFGDLVVPRPGLVKLVDGKPVSTIPFTSLSGEDMTVDGFKALIEKDIKTSSTEDYSLQKSGAEQTISAQEKKQSELNKIRSELSQKIYILYQKKGEIERLQKEYNSNQEIFEQSENEVQKTNMMNNIHSLKMRESLCQAQADSLQKEINSLYADYEKLLAK